MKVLSLFSGIGAFEKAIYNLGIPYELIAYCDNNPYASKSYAAIHGVPETMNLGDITKVDETKLAKDIDVLTYGFPCQDISNAGMMKGLIDESGRPTRSGLFFDARRIIAATKPMVAIAENVKMLTSKKFTAEFKTVLESLERAGYNNYWQILNAKGFGIPQNRERVFIVSIRKDIDSGNYRFPDGFPLQRRLIDVVESAVDEKYYVKTELTRKLVINSEVTEPQVLRLVRNEHGKEIRKQYDRGEISAPWGDMKQYEPRIDGVANTVSTVLKDNILLVREATKQGYAEATIGDSINFEQPSSKTRRGRVGKQVAQTLNTTCNLQAVVEPSLRLRFFTPRECFRLMGFDDADFDKARAVNSESQLYKQAGNSIAVPVLEHIFKSLIDSGIEFNRGIENNVRENTLEESCV